jgi:hypothetical protein
MTDTSNSAGDRVDQAIEAAKQGLSDLRSKLSTVAAGAGDEISKAVDAVSAKVDEIQAAWTARRDQQ